MKIAVNVQFKFFLFKIFNYLLINHLIEILCFTI